MSGEPDQKEPLHLAGMLLLPVDHLPGGGREGVLLGVFRKVGSKLGGESAP